MSQSTQVSTPPSATTATRSRSLIWGIASFVVGSAIVLWSVYGEDYSSNAQQTSQQHAVPFILGFLAVVTAVVFGGLVPWASRATAKPGVALGLAVLAILTAVFYWSALPIVFGVAAAVIATAARSAASRDGRPGGMATAALIVGSLGMVLSFAALIFDAISS